MKTLKDAILEKLRVDDIVLDKKFPIDGTLDDMIEFLKEQGFKLLKNNDESISNLFNKYHKHCIHNINDCLWFADTSRREVSKDNPIFFISMSGKRFGVYYCDDYGDNWITYIVENDKEEFLKELNKRFGWQ